MTKKEDTQAMRAASELDRRQFLGGTGMAFGLGTGGLLASLGLSGCATKPAAAPAAAASPAAASPAAATPAAPAASPGTAAGHGPV